MAEGPGVATQDEVAGLRRRLADLEATVAQLDTLRANHARRLSEIEGEREDMTKQLDDAEADLRAAHERMDRMGIPRLPATAVHIEPRPQGGSAPPFLLAFEDEATRNVFAAAYSRLRSAPLDDTVDPLALAMRHINASSGDRREHLVTAIALIARALRAAP